MRERKEGNADNALLLLVTFFTMKPSRQRCCVHRRKHVPFHILTLIRKSIHGKGNGTHNLYSSEYPWRFLRLSFESDKCVTSLRLVPLDQWQALMVSGQRRPQKGTRETTPPSPSTSVSNSIQMLILGGALPQIKPEHSLL